MNGRNERNPQITPPSAIPAALLRSLTTPCVLKRGMSNDFKVSILHKSRVNNHSIKFFSINTKAHRSHLREIMHCSRLLSS